MATFRHQPLELGILFLQLLGPLGPLQLQPAVLLRETESRKEELWYANYKPETIVSLLRGAEAAIGNGQTTPHACREAGITRQTMQQIHSYRRIECCFGEVPKGFSSHHESD